MSTEPNKPIVLLDVDGVLANFVGHTLEQLASCGGTQLDVADWDTWNLLDNPKLTELDKEKIKTLWNSVGFCAGIHPYPNTLKAVAELKKLAEVQFVTSPMWNPHWPGERTEWLCNWFHVKPDSVTHTSKKTNVWGNVFVDDKPEHVQAWHERWVAPPRTISGGHSAYNRAFLWSHPYNSPVRGVERIDDWAAVIDRVEKIKARYEKAFEYRNAPIQYIG